MQTTSTALTNVFLQQLPEEIFYFLECYLSRGPRVCELIASVLNHVDSWNHRHLYVSLDNKKPYFRSTRPLVVNYLLAEQSNPIVFSRRPRRLPKTRKCDTLKSYQKRTENFS